MKIETLLLAVLSQLLQVGIRSTSRDTIDLSTKSSAAVLQNLTYECHCHCTHEPVAQSHWGSVVGIAVGICLGRTSVVTLQPSGIPSPRRRGHGVLVEHSTWHSCGCVLL